MDLFESPLEPDILLGSAFSRSKPLQGERRLMLAVLRDAVDCYHRGRRTREPATRLLFDETRAWVESTDRRATFSFESICDVLDIDADYLRGRLRQRRAAGATAAWRRLGCAKGRQQPGLTPEPACAGRRRGKLGRRAYGKCFGSRTSFVRFGP